MSKTAVVHSQQRWEYLYFTRKSENALFNELNVVGLDGWELVGTHYYKDAKGVMTWIAFLKRPSAGTAPAASGAPSGAAAGAGNQAVGAERRSEATANPPGFDLSGEVFDIKKET